ncbi:tyrosine-protein phosphatase [Paenibacillus gansuensis]|uniref:Tyrosine-protein phosphatase n=1 Tax=Paenibacillus gansuensis TaxID=306542 RepID=A0ABW5PIF3_9BACL
MIDIHCHILPGVDDGAKTLEESVGMARLAYEDGVRAIIATPHFTDSLRVKRETVLRLTADVQDALELAGIPLKVYPGNELRLESFDFVKEQVRHQSFCYLGRNGNFVLLEQRWAEYTDSTPEVIRWFADQGVQPIIPHPERHIFFRTEPQLLLDCLEAGAWTQVSADSLIGKNSKEAEEFAYWMIDGNYVHTLATDAHNLIRKPNLSEGFARVRQRGGAKQAEAIMERMNFIWSEL